MAGFFEGNEKPVVRRRKFSDFYSRDNDNDLGGENIDNFKHTELSARYDISAAVSSSV